MSDHLRKAIEEHRAAIPGDSEGGEVTKTEVSLAQLRERVSKAAAESKLDALAAEVRKSDPTLSAEQAYDRALKSPEGRAAYAASVGLDPTPAPVAKVADGTVEAIAKRLQDADPTLDDERAYTRALQMDEGKRWYGQQLARERGE